MTSSSKPPSPLIRLMWTAIFGVPGGILSWLGFQQEKVSPFMLSLTISGLILLALAAIAFVAFLLALVELGSPELIAAANQAIPPIQQAKAPGGPRDFCPYCGAKYSRWLLILFSRGPQLIACGKCGKQATVAWSTGVWSLGAMVVTILLASALLPVTLSADRTLRVLMALPIALIVGAIVGRLALAVYVPENDTSKSG